MIAWIKSSFKIYFPNKIQILKLFFIYRSNKALLTFQCSLKTGASKNVRNFCVLKVGRYLEALLNKIINLNGSEEGKKWPDYWLVWLSGCCNSMLGQLISDLVLVHSFYSCVTQVAGIFSWHSKCFLSSATKCCVNTCMLLNSQIFLAKFHWNKDLKSIF